MTSKSRGPAGPAAGNATLAAWVTQQAARTKPDRVVWCDGSEEERRRLTLEAIAAGILVPLDRQKRPGCTLHRSHPNDVARVEQLTYVCTRSEEAAGPVNHWMAPSEAYARLGRLLDGGMTGRTMYVVPYLMGPPGSKFSKVGIELTDSVYVALSMGVMTRMGSVALEQLGESPAFNRGLHAMLDGHPDRRFICHFPEDDTIWSVGSNYGGNVLLGKKCFALRLGSWLARAEGWLAEHMLILGVESPEGQTTYLAAAFPSACGKTNLAMLVPPRRFAGWKVWTVGDDIAWLRPGPDGRLWAVNPEAGYFGVAPGTNEETNPNAMATIAHDTIFTNVALTEDGDVWWEGMTPEPPDRLLDWQGRPWDKHSGRTAAHPNARFTSPMKNNPALSRRAGDPGGVPISAIIFGGRRSDTVPLVLQSFNWTHGVFLGATLGSETTAAATGEVGVIRRDPMAMLPFCGYDMGEYFGHWLSMQRALPNPPKIFQVNWFRKKDGRFLWPGYGENMRVLAWIIDRALGRSGARETPLGWVPRAGDLDLAGLDVSAEDFEAAAAIDLPAWRRELASDGEWFAKLSRTLPRELALQRELLLARLG